MHFKLLVVFTVDEMTDEIMDAARDAGARGCTLISSAVGEGIKKPKTFFGLTLETQRDVVLFVVEEHLSRRVLERIAEVGEFETKSSAGMAIQLDIEDAVGISHQIRELESEVEKEL